MFDFILKQQKRRILHLDCDAFFASVEQALNPNLKGLPLLVGHTANLEKGIVLAASYEAKKFGVFSGMPMFQARKICPQAVVVNGNFRAYKEFSRRLYCSLKEFSNKVEMVSIEEAFVDIEDAFKRQNENYRCFLQKFLLEVVAQVGVSISCGAGSGKLIAKTASSLNKPKKLTIIPWGKEKDFLRNLPLSALPGVGRGAEVFLTKRGLNKVGDLSALTQDEVWRKFGKNFLSLWQKIQGADSGEVQEKIEPPKSISKEKTLEKSTRSVVFCLNVLAELTAQVVEKMRKYRLRCGRVFVKIRYKKEGKFEDKIFYASLSKMSDRVAELQIAIKSLFLLRLEKSSEEPLLKSNQDIRLLGIGMTDLKMNYNLSLFEEVAIIKIDEYNLDADDGSIQRDQKSISRLCFDVQAG